MQSSARRISGSVFAGIAMSLGMGMWPWEPARAESLHFVPANFDPYGLPGSVSWVRVFPLDGPEMTIDVPPELKTLVPVSEFGPDGKTLYAEKMERQGDTAGIYKVEFQPLRIELLPGSTGPGHLYSHLTCLTFEHTSGKVLWAWADKSNAVFELDARSSTTRLLPVDEPSLCGGSGGTLSPDGRWVINRSGKDLVVLNRRGGEGRTVKGLGGNRSFVWSPNGQRIAALGDDKIILIDPDEPSRLRNLGSSRRGLPVWSPDSRYLLIRTPQPSCALTLYGESLVIIDVETGKRTPVKASHCRVKGGTIGWLDSEIAVSTR